MEKAEILKKLEIVISKVREYIATKSTTLDLVEKQALQELAPIITPNKQWCFSCSSSLGDLMIAVLCYYERESKPLAEEDNSENIATS